MNILIVSQYFWPENFRINDLASELAARGHQVTVLTGLPNYPEGRWFPGYGVNRLGGEPFGAVWVLRVPLFARRQGKGWQLALNYLSFAISAALLGPWLLRRQKVDLIFVYEPSPFTVGLPAIMLRRLRRAPLFFWVQDLWPESLAATGAIKSPAIMKPISAMVRAIYRRCDKVLVQSRGFSAPAAAAGAVAARIRYFPNWAEDFYRPLPVDPVLSARLPGGFRLVFAGNLGEAQSLDTLLDAAEQLKEETGIHWLILGDGRRAVWLRHQIVERGLEDSVHLFGRYPAEQMPAYFAAADALLVTLRCEPIFASTIPSKVQSYLACGKPLLGSLDGEGARIIDEAGAGFAVPAEDGEALKAAILRLYRLDPAERQAMGDRARTYYDRHFRRDRLIDELEQWMVEAIDKGLLANSDQA